MDYELAKQLKDAGFPQDGSKTCFYRNPVTGEKGGGCFVFPTLSELIEACGEVFTDLQKGEDEVGDIEWTAIAYTGRLIHGTGNTPEEAVAKLWLQLNK